ncbi:hypothetical protein [Anoxybacillus sp. ST70]|nr:hypothetical protein [Anoxybacillus sp. ST70]
MVVESAREHPTSIELAQNQWIRAAALAWISSLSAACSIMHNFKFLL